jgi:ribosomal protein L37E
MLDSQVESSHNEGRKKIRLVLGKSSDFHEVRCESCGALLYRELIKSGPVTRIVEIKCRRCGTVKVS